MKRILLLLCFAISTSGSFAQTTYYWKGAVGTATAPTDWQVAANWNTATDGSGAVRTTPANDDILVFDGTANTTAAMFVGNVPTQTVGTLKITNNATVSINTIVAPVAVNNALTSVTAYGGCTYTIIGSGFSSNLKVGDFIYTPAVSTNLPLSVQVLAIKDDNTITTSIDNNIGAGASLTSYYKHTTLYPDKFIVDAGSTFSLGGAVTGTPFNNFAIITKGGTIAGTINFPSRGGQNRLYCTTANKGDASKGLRFTSGSACNYTTTNLTGYTKQYLLGNTLGLYDSNGVFIFDGGDGANNLTPGYSGNAGIVFESGSTFTNSASGGQFSVFGNSHNANNVVLVFTPSVYFASGSNYVSNTGSISSAYFPVISGITFGNLEFKAGLPYTGSSTTSCTLNATVDNLIIGGTTAASSIAGNAFVKGNITNSSTNATSAAMSFTGNVFLTGSSNQTITPFVGGVTGTLSFTNLIIADKAQATLAGNITATNLSILGKLNFGSFTATGTGTLSTYAGPYSKATTATAFTKGSSTIGGINADGAGTTTYAYPIGASVTNASYIPFGTIYRSYTSGGNGVLSSFAKASADVTANETATFSIAGSSYTTSSADLAASTPGFATRLLDINSTVLPLDLLSFDGSAGVNGVTLKWNTAKEVNVKNFVIQKRIVDGSFADLGQVSASNSLVLNNYSYTDVTADAGVTNYYRLKVVDNDGAFKPSNVIGIFMPGFKTSAQGLSIYPNPATSVLNVVFNEANKGAEYEVLTVEGRVALKGVVGENSTKATIDVSSLPTGTYFIDCNHLKGKFIKK